jgi:[ribosomal protein S18]-alanine N-acetyltransferase
MHRLIEVKPDNFSDYIEGILTIEQVSFLSPWSLNAFKSETEKHISHLWVLVTETSVTGYICFWMLEDEIQLINIAVHREKQRNQLGQLLLTRMIEKGVSNGIKNVWLEVRPSNLGARHLYKKMGFIETGRRPGYYSETNEDAILMSLDLSSHEREPFRIL